MVENVYWSGWWNVRYAFGWLLALLPLLLLPANRNRAAWAILAPLALVALFAGALSATRSDYTGPVTMAYYTFMSLAVGCAWVWLSAHDLHAARGWRRIPRLIMLVLLVGLGSLTTAAALFAKGVPAFPLFTAPIAAVIACVALIIAAVRGALRNPALALRFPVPHLALCAAVLLASETFEPIDVTGHMADQVGGIVVGIVAIPVLLWLAGIVAARTRVRSLPVAYTLWCAVAVALSSLTWNWDNISGWWTLESIKMFIALLGAPFLAVMPLLVMNRWNALYRQRIERAVAGRAEPQPAAPSLDTSVPAPVLATLCDQNRDH